MKKRILVTCAFPYANGSLHIGHFLEHIQADIWVRYKKMRGHEVWFICADDAHGTPIMLKSQSLKMSPESFISDIYKDHVNDLEKFNINYDNYYSTHSSENSYFLKKIYHILDKKGLIQTRNIFQLFDNTKRVFLPDRFVKGACPICHTKDQYGDHCEVCGSSYSAVELIKPVSMLSGNCPILKKSLHFFFNLPYFESMLRSWVMSGVLQASVVKKLDEWFKLGLREWDISRDSPYFGFNIPGFLDKYFYVWLDAPIGYISTFKNLCTQRNNLNFLDFWKKNSECELYQFIGKDIVYFHSLFWPSILEASNFRKPTKIFVHGHVTINGLKLSKSRGDCILAKNWIKNLDSDSLRYYYASKLSSKIQDIEVNAKHFLYKINSDVVNKIVNLASRVSSFINIYFNNELSSRIDDLALYKRFVTSSSYIEKMLENCEFNSAISMVISLADIANSYVDNKKPWNLTKNIKNSNTLHDICTTVLNLFRILMTWLKPVMPDLAKNSEKFLNIKLEWANICIPLLNHKISIFKALRHRIEDKQIKFLLPNNFE
ncbi:methionyl-tRNA synthetase [Buchnera aphidicola str. Bp (Baizongia pistaciae)]|uniref:Methionine--tRNA ligase n=1 Tax=Buchnera aphidicola subsp. Baizongia pistaciae (strain Bp) TaxID=224915 RepID=SYM_BUCBP|nr:methionine--tRNA ligase [Buchnera aphidicola]Q89AX4.1 RecName: Full=Methionine--tRNA ligase; AltName: Full=Methionyl-tRNA synthetase; Short=MetRS [Buchnera aphidicola str. Bp (Baizongia pistaciae)]AAO26838.1 methionyl-tRNA synthetase [Buchnera aphidicola str. Bp (Baizongia pistaciae)]